MQIEDCNWRLTIADLAIADYRLRVRRLNRESSIANESSIGNQQFNRQSAIANQRSSIVNRQFNLQSATCNRQCVIAD